MGQGGMAYLRLPPIAQHNRDPLVEVPVAFGLGGVRRRGLESIFNREIHVY